MLRISIFTICLMLCGSAVFGDLGDCLWGGKNEETAYSAGYTGMNNGGLAPPAAPAMNLGAPPTSASGIPVQATPNTNAATVPQATVPMMTVPTGPVGSVGRPATEAAGNEHASSVIAAPQGTEIVYILPSQQAPEVICFDGSRSIPAAETKVVPPGTPGAIPVSLQTVTIRRPVTQLHWTYGPIVHKTEQLVNVVNPRTGKVVRSYNHTEETATALPWLHLREVVTYETVDVKMGRPISQTPTVAGTVNTTILPLGSTGGTAHQSNYQGNYPGEPLIKTIVIP